MIKRIKNNSEDIALLSTFIKNSGNSLEKFRYFNSRDLSVIADHIYTILILDINQNPVAYGHLDPDQEIVWLGICVSEKATGNGYGDKIMTNLIDEASKISLKEIVLKVDSNNTKAISLYQKHFFQILSEEKGKFFIMKHILKNDKL
jgi:ribosomal protein S18 acetylase RimI-like enzyme